MVALTNKLRQFLLHNDLALLQVSRSVNQCRLWVPEIAHRRAHSLWLEAQVRICKGYGTAPLEAVRRKPHTQATIFLQLAPS